MTQDEFEEIFEHIFGLSRKVLVEKAKEYAAGGDRMHNFKMAASLTTSGTPEDALWGFLLKHLISVHDMIVSKETYPQERWEEKIGDAINYFILLYALVIETGSLEKTSSEIDPSKLSLSMFSGHNFSPDDQT